MLIHDKFYNEGSNSFDKFLNIVNTLSKRQNVEFALYCAKNVFNLVEEEHKENVKHCIDLIEKWLIDENSVTNEELRNATYITQSDATWAAYAAYYATAAAAAWVGTYAEAANETAWTATYALAADVVNNNNKNFNEYLVIANSHFTKTTTNCPNYEIEGKILYLINELDENIIVHKDKYYVNMNGIERCPEYGFSSQEELLEKLLYSKDQFWEFTRNWLDQLYKNQQT